MSQRLSFDIFCRVIDNYGDIGVCWRLARQLAAHGQVSGPVRLWVDDLHSLARLVPQAARKNQRHDLNGVQVHPWSQAEDDTVQPLAVVIEAFGCDLPAAFRTRMQATPPHYWLNLEYLSAQSWVEDCHGLPSLQADGLRKHFFFPGFTDRTGGLLREPDLIARRDAWQRNPKNRAALLQALGMPADWINGLMEHGWQQIYVFCYPYAPLQALRTERPVVLLAAPGTPPTQASPHLYRLDCPFVAQAQFDELLWGSDLNLVRGEDSLVRAIWAARPFLWQLYAQAQAAHLPKLDAWLALADCPPEAAALMRAWNAPQATPNPSALSALSAAAANALTPPAWQRWCEHPL